MAKETPKSTEKQYHHVTTLIEGVKRDNLTQFGEIKKEFGGVVGRLNDHHERIKALEKDKIKRDAIEQYKKDHPEVAQKVFNDGQAGYNENSNTVAINKDLLNALKILGLVIAALGVALIGMKYKP